VITLVRADSDAAAQARIDTVLDNVFGDHAARYRGRVRAVAAELTAPRLGLSDDRWNELAANTATIVHSAASVSFTLPLECAREINLEGTRRMLELASRVDGLERYAHVSTAYVAGTHTGSFAESDLDVGQGFRNTYEQTKFEAEQLVRASGLPYTILRPSIVVGDRRSGWTSAFNVLYWPLRAFARGLFTAVPANPTAPVDVVPVDYVADAIYTLSSQPEGVGATYHLTAGAHASTIQELADAASSYFQKPPPRVLPPAEFAELVSDSVGSPALESGAAYFPYFSVSTFFDNSATRALLEPAGISAPPLREYLGRLLDFATRSRWGKRPIARAQALGI
jgi:thioester reductase-like protein